MRYDFFTLSLLSSLERYLPFMTDSDIADILEYGIAPSPWKIQVWENRMKEGGTAARDEAVRGAIQRQK